MQVNKIRTAIFTGTIFAFLLTLLVCFCFSATKGDLSRGFHFVAGFAYMITGIVLMNYIFLYGDGEELHFSSLFYSLPGAYLLYSSYSIFCSLSPLELHTNYSGNGFLYQEITTLFFVAGLWNIVMSIFFSYGMHWLTRLVRALSGVCAFVPMIVLTIMLICGVSPNFDYDGTLNLLSYIFLTLSTLLFGVYAFFQIRDCED